MHTERDREKKERKMAFVYGTVKGWGEDTPTKGAKVRHNLIFQIGNLKVSEVFWRFRIPDVTDPWTETVQRYQIAKEQDEQKIGANTEIGIRSVSEDDLMGTALGLIDPMTLWITDLLVHFFESLCPSIPLTASELTTINLYKNSRKVFEENPGIKAFQKLFHDSIQDPSDVTKMVMSARTTRRAAAFKLNDFRDYTTVPVMEQYLLNTFGQDRNKFLTVEGNQYRYVRFLSASNNPTFIVECVSCQKQKGDAETKFYEIEVDPSPFSRSDSHQLPGTYRDPVVGEQYVAKLAYVDDLDDYYLRCVTLDSNTYSKAIVGFYGSTEVINPVACRWIILEYIKCSPVGNQSLSPKQIQQYVNARWFLNHHGIGEARSDGNEQSNVFICDGDNDDLKLIDFGGKNRFGYSVFGPNKAIDWRVILQSVFKICSTLEDGICRHALMCLKCGFMGNCDLLHDKCQACSHELKHVESKTPKVLSVFKMSYPVKPPNEMIDNWARVLLQEEEKEELDEKSMQFGKDEEKDLMIESK